MGLLRTTNDTVDLETPATSATSEIVGFLGMPAARPGLVTVLPPMGLFFFLAGVIGRAFSGVSHLAPAYKIPASQEPLSRAAFY